MFLHEDTRKYMRVVATSDTHGHHRAHPIPDGDVFVHAGDITRAGEIETIIDFADWLSILPHRYKIIVPGNHDFCFDISHARYNHFAERVVEAVGAHYLIDASRMIDGKKFYGSPWVPNLERWAFWDRNRDRFIDAPRDIDVLVTHGPPRGVRDGSGDKGVEPSRANHFGSAHLVRYINHCWQLKLHIFGHVHEGYGRSPDDELIFVNASMCTRGTREQEPEPKNPPIVIDL
jgi:Icc-related predicted phosphoesterase